MKLIFPEWIWRILRVAQAIALLGCMIGWILVQSHVDYLERTSPRALDTATGETVAVFWKTVYVYMTPDNARFVRYSHYIDALVLALVAVLLLPTIYRAMPAMYRAFKRLIGL